MRFWDLEHDPGSIAVVDETGQAVRYGALSERVEREAVKLRGVGGRQLVFLEARNDLASLVAYLANLRAGHVPLLLPPHLAAPLRHPLEARYQPDLPMALHPDLALLLSTSGSTGSPRLVRLSASALQANAEAIVDYLRLTPADRAITALPMHYSYGLSVINSHLQAGASISLTDAGVLDKRFWERMASDRVTSIAGVPTLYRMLHRTGFERRELPALRTLTQAGGRLDDALTRHFLALADSRGWTFYVMYGQTEATARISYVPPQWLAGKIGSIGIAIPGGALALDPITSEIVYRGPNVMMGYAESREDLALGDTSQGVLRTGELGRMDDDGYCYLTGRLKRFVKLSGNRIGLDEVEAMLQRELGVAVAVGGSDEALVAVVEAADREPVVQRAGQLLSDRYGLHHSLFRVTAVAQLPLLASGKVDYQQLVAA